MNRGGTGRGKGREEEVEGESEKGNGFAPDKEQVKPSERGGTSSVETARETPKLFTTARYVVVLSVS